MQRIAISALILSALMVVPSGQQPASAAVIPLSLNDLVQQSDVCIRGQVVNASSAWSEGDSMIFTIYTVQMTEQLMGQSVESVQVRVPGGTLDGVRIRNGEAPTYLVGEEVVCFLRPEAGGTWQTFGWFQGKYTLLNGMVREMLGTSYDALRADILTAVANK